MSLIKSKRGHSLKYKTNLVIINKLESLRLRIKSKIKHLRIYISQNNKIIRNS